MLFDICKNKESVANYSVLTEPTVVINSFLQIFAYLLCYITMLIFLFTTEIIIVVLWEKKPMKMNS